MNDIFQNGFRPNPNFRGEVPPGLGDGVVPAVGGRRPPQFLRPPPPAGPAAGPSFRNAGPPPAHPSSSLPARPNKPAVEDQQQNSDTKNDEGHGTEIEKKAAVQEDTGKKLELWMRN